MTRLTGRSALITGAASGFGEAAARLFVAAGARITIADRDAERGAAVATSLGEAARFVRLDHTMPEQCVAAVEQAEARWGGLDILVNNAGIGWAGAFADHGDAEAERVLAVDLSGPMRMTRAAIPALRRSAARGGEAPAIVFTASGLGLRGGPMTSLYAAAKHGVVGLMRSLAAELGREGIRVNAVCPGIVDTPAVRTMWGEETDAALARFMSGNLVPWSVRTEDVANAIVFLASGEARGITSVALPVDAGRHGV